MTFLKPEDIQQKYYEKTAHHYDGMHGKEGEYARAFAISVMKFWNVNSILDVGAGTGQFMNALTEAGFEASGIEPVSALVDIAIEKHGISKNRIMTGDARKLPYADKSFDVVCSIAVLHHVSTPNLIVSEMLRVARKGIIIVDSNRFGQGPPWQRYMKLFLSCCGLWTAFEYCRTGGRMYRISEHDGLFYSYSVYDSFNMVAKWADNINVVQAAKQRKATSWLHPLLTARGAILFASKN